MKKFKKDLKDFQKKAKKTPLECEEDTLNLIKKIDTLSKDENIKSDPKKVDELDKAKKVLTLFATNITALKEINRQ